MNAAVHEIISVDDPYPGRTHRGATLSCGHSSLYHKRWEVGASVPCTHCVLDISEVQEQLRSKFVIAPCGCWHFAGWR